MCHGQAVRDQMMSELIIACPTDVYVENEDGETVLNAGDSFHCCGGCPKSVTNNGTTVTKMLVTLLPPQA